MRFAHDKKLFLRNLHFVGFLRQPKCGDCLYAVYVFESSERGQQDEFHSVLHSPSLVCPAFFFFFAQPTKVELPFVF